jgi:hypothetical protein
MNDYIKRNQEGAYYEENWRTINFLHNMLLLGYV